MSTTITIDTDSLGLDFIEGVKKLFPHKKVEISISEADTTEFIEGNPKYKEELLERIKNYDENKKVISLKASDLL